MPLDFQKALGAPRRVQQRRRQADEMLNAVTQLLAGRLVGIHDAVISRINPEQRPGVFHDQAVEQQLFFSAPAFRDVAKLQHHPDRLAGYKARHDGAFKHAAILELQLVKTLVLLVCPQRVQLGDVLCLVAHQHRQVHHQLPFLPGNQKFGRGVPAHFDELGVEILGTAGVMN